MRTIIRWQYPGQELKQIIGANGFTIARDTGNCYTNYALKGIYQSSSNGSGDFQNQCYSYRAWHTDERLPIKGRVIGMFYENFGSVSVPRVKYQESDGTKKIYNSLIYDTITNFGLTNYLGCVRTGVAGFDGTYVITEVIRLDNSPDDCCVIKILKDEQVVYSEAQKDCPEAYKVVEQCPSGTCEVECGSYICCYDSNGIAVASIPK